MDVTYFKSPINGNYSDKSKKKLLQKIVVSYIFSARKIFENLSTLQIEPLFKCNNIYYTWAQQLFGTHRMFGCVTQLKKKNKKSIETKFCKLAASCNQPDSKRWVMVAYFQDHNLQCSGACFMQQYKPKMKNSKLIMRPSARPELYFLCLCNIRSARINVRTDGTRADTFRL